MPLEEMDSSSEGSGSDDEMNELESREAAFVVRSLLHTVIPPYKYCHSSIHTFSPHAQHPTSIFLVFQVSHGSRHHSMQSQPILAFEEDS